MNIDLIISKSISGDDHRTDKSQRAFLEMNIDLINPKAHHLCRTEVLRGLRNFLNMDRSEHHSTDRLKKRGVQKGSGRHSTPQGRERSVFNQANIGTVSRATLGRPLRDGVERVWTFPSATIPS